MNINILFRTMFGYFVFTLNTMIMLPFLLFLSFFTAIFRIDRDKKSFVYLTKIFCYLFFHLFFIQKLTIIKKSFSPFHKGDRRLYLLNHASMYDSILLYMVPGPVKIVIKEKWGRSPIGFLQKCTGNIILKENAGVSDSFSTIELIKEKLLKGIPVVIFPEGTRSKNGKIGKFYTGAFQLALEAEADIVPVVLDSWDTIRPGKLWIRDVRPWISFLPMIRFSEFKDLSPKENAKKVRFRMIRELLSIRENRRMNEPDYGRNSDVYKKMDDEMKYELENNHYQEFI